ncbi:MAG TPA: response regulator, partial [Chloroflexia bacterium]|nr:response regulator [Chloroflexia bacterium]
IEDDPTWAALLRDCLAEHYLVTWAPDRETGLAQVASRPPDAIVLDWHLAWGTGQAVLDQLRAVPGQARIPVVIFSSMPIDAAFRQHLAGSAGAGPLVVVPKSARRETVLRTLQQLLLAT